MTHAEAPDKGETHPAQRKPALSHSLCAKPGFPV